MQTQNTPDPFGYNRFSFDLHRATVQGHVNENAVCSPWGVTCVLGMLHAGASDEAAAEIDAVFDFSAMSKPQPDFLADIPQKFRTGRPSERNIELIGANSCWLNRDFDALPEYKSDIASRYHATINTLNFDKPRPTVKHINEWCANQTQNLIRNIVTHDDFDPVLQQQLVLLNAVYFKGQWQLPFSRQDTKNETFHLADGTTMQTPMMSKTDQFQFRYHAGKNYEAVRLNYRGSASMIILLPRENRTLAEMEARLDDVGFALICKNLKSRRGTVKIPRFKFNSGDNSLIPALKSLGINAIFDSTANHFPKINSAAVPLYVTLMRQKTVIKVDEQGTEAAAATMGMGGYGGYDNSEPFEFTADHPFLFVICEDATNAVLFIGRVHVPES